MVMRAVVASLAAMLVAAITGAPAFARAPQALDLLNLADLGDYRSGLAVSPDGGHVAVVERRAQLGADDYTHTLVIVAIDGSGVRRIADAGGIILRNDNGRLTGAAADRAPAWSPDGRWLAYLKRVDDRVELWRVDPEGGMNDRVTNALGDVRDFAWIGADTLVVETATPRTELAGLRASQERSGFHIENDFEPYFSLRAPTPVNAGMRRQVIDLTTGRMRDADDAEVTRLSDRGQWPPEAVSFDSDGRRSAWISPLAAGDPASSPALGVFASEAGRDVRCSDAACSGRLLDVWQFGSQIIFRRMEGHGQGVTALYVWDVVRNRVRRLRRADEELHGCVRVRGALACLQEAATQPRRLVGVDIGSGDLAILYDPNPEWRDFDLTRVERIEVRDAFGNDAFAHLVYPINYVVGRRYPVVVVQYRSRGFLRGGVGGEYPIHPLAARGYFVLSVDRPEWRGVEAQLPPDELRTRTELDGSENIMKQSALEAMLTHLDVRGLSDPDRVGVTGLSDGAETLFWAITRSDLFAAAVTSTPPIDATAWTLGSESFRNSLRASGMHGPWPDAQGEWAEWWARNTTLLHAAEIEAPLLMNLPESEALMGFPLATRMEELGRPAEIYLYPGAFHVKWRPAQILAAQNRAMDWLDFWLRNVERGDPDEPQRLERWRALRDARASSH
jgi:dipeptidyl aminopeptidase/acylaminoacyl peptidase